MTIPMQVPRFNSATWVYHPESNIRNYIQAMIEIERVKAKEGRHLCSGAVRVWIRVGVREGCR